VLLPRHGAPDTALAARRAALRRLSGLLSGLLRLLLVRHCMLLDVGFRSAPAGRLQTLERGGARSSRKGREVAPRLLAGVVAAMIGVQIRG